MRYFAIILKIISLSLLYQINKMIAGGQKSLLLVSPSLFTKIRFQQGKDDGLIYPIINFKGSIFGKLSSVVSNQVLKPVIFEIDQKILQKLKAIKPTILGTQQNYNKQINCIQTLFPHKKTHILKKTPMVQSISMNFFNTTLHLKLQVLGVNKEVRYYFRDKEQNQTKKKK